MSNQHQQDDPTAVQRKSDHIELAFRSQVKLEGLDSRFYYEPMLAAHPTGTSSLSTSFSGKKLKVPLWVSSMTGGTQLAKKINIKLAEICAEFGMGMGLGSCRQLLFDDAHFEDFNVRKIIGNEYPLFANLGVAQIEKLLKNKETEKIDKLLSKLAADGLICHVNPLQEWCQEEGDRFERPPLETIQELLEIADYKIIVKEVGQGFGPRSMEALLKLPLEAVDFGAAGGTNFALLELLRQQGQAVETKMPFAHVGHSAAEMCTFVNRFVEEKEHEIKCRQIIISGGIQNILDGYYAMKTLSLPSVIGQASSFLKFALQDGNELRNYVQGLVDSLAVANAYLTVKQIGHE